MCGILSAGHSLFELHKKAGDVRDRCGTIRRDGGHAVRRGRRRPAEAAGRAAEGCNEGAGSEPGEIQGMRRRCCCRRLLPNRRL